MSGVLYQYSAATIPHVWRDTVEEALADAEASLGTDINGQPKLIESPQLMGWSPNAGVYAPGISASASHLVPWDEAPVDAKDQTTVTLAYSRHAFDEEMALLVGPVSLSGATWARDTHSPADVRRFHSGVVVFSATTLTGFDNNPLSVSGGNWYWYGDIPIFCRSVTTCGGVPDGYIAIPDAPDYYITPDGSIKHYGNCEEVSGTFKQLSVSTYTSGTDFQPFLTRPSGPVLESTHADYSNQAYWDAAYAAAVADGILPEGLTYSSTGTGMAGTFYPVEVATVCACAHDGKVIQTSPVLLRDIVADLFQRAGLTPDQYDVSQL